MRCETRQIIESALALENVPAEQRQRIIFGLEHNTPVWKTEREAAEILGVSAPLMARWRNDGQYQGQPFPFAVWYPPMTKTRSPRYELSELVAYIENNRGETR